MGGFSSLLTGSNPTLDKMTNQNTQVANWGTGLGEKDIGSASNFYNTIAGGDPAAIAKLLAPQTQAMQQQGQQQKQTAAQFGDRSGGTNAGMQMLDDRTRAQITNLIAQLTGNAVAGEAGLGESALASGQKANQMAVDDSQLQMQNMANSMLGQAIGSGANALIKGGTNALGMIPGLSAVVG